jgi:hypothetical protein
MAGFDGAAWLAARGWAPRPGERVVSLFAYANTALPALLDALADRPTLLLACPGPLQAQVPTGPACATSPCPTCRRTTTTACCGPAT